ncbi:hypothetical protein NL676_030109 [Syzygium grande]|nr:hypothetical protein NL676_030109 [Syzygium grande]
MEKLISSRCDLQHVPDSYVLPPESRPGEEEFALCKTIPVIELRQDRAENVRQVLKAGQEFGFFQLTNYGVSKKLMSDVLEVAEEFFELPNEDKASVYSEDPKRSCRLYTSIDYDNEKVHFWRDNLRHPCHPVDEHVQCWPEKPARYRELAGKYSVEVRKLSMLLLELIGEGLGLESGFFERDELNRVQLMALNRYPPCPNPSLTLGLPRHRDVNLITVILQGPVHGLQVLEDGQWLALQPLPDAFVINIGLALQIISNGKLRSAEHRVTTNRTLARTTVTTFLHPSGDCMVEPVKGIIDNHNPSLYRSFLYKDFLSTYIKDTYEGELPLKRYTL